MKKKILIPSQGAVIASIALGLVLGRSRFTAEKKVEASESMFGDDGPTATKSPNEPK